VYDGSRVPLRDGAVDTVLLSLALHHAENPDRVLAEALRVARKRVLVTESTYRWGWERNALEVADRWANRGRGMEGNEAGGGATLHFRTVGSWLGAFSEAGAEVLESRRLNRVGHRHHLFVLQPRGVRGAPAPLP
jgi:SAM-dependent methyltransferase